MKYIIFFCLLGFSCGFMIDNKIDPDNSIHTERYDSGFRKVIINLDTINTINNINIMIISEKNYRLYMNGSSYETYSTMSNKLFRAIYIQSEPIEFTEKFYIVITNKSPKTIHIKGEISVLDDSTPGFIYIICIIGIILFLCLMLLLSQIDSG